MTIQLPLPGPPRYLSNRDPIAALEEIQRDKVTAAYAIELKLDRLAEKHGISHTVIAKAVQGYVDDMLGDVILDWRKSCGPNGMKRRTCADRCASSPGSS